MSWAPREEPAIKLTAQERVLLQLRGVLGSICGGDPADDSLEENKCGPPLIASPNPQSDMSCHAFAVGGASFSARRTSRCPICQSPGALRMFRRPWRKW